MRAASAANPVIVSRIPHTTQESFMTHTRFIPLAVTLAIASAMIACTTAPAMPMGSTPANSMATPERMAAMDAQMKAMRDMHTKMMNAKTPEERQAMMADHMKAMQGGMGMMKGMSDMSGMGAMGDPKGMSADMAQHRKMMAQYMEMMQMMMDMMMQRMPPSPGKQ
jgi:hypothetical protein